MKGLPWTGNPLLNTRIMKKALLFLLAVAGLSVSCSDRGGDEGYRTPEYGYMSQEYDPVMDKTSDYLIVVGDIQYYTLEDNRNVECLRLTSDWIWSQYNHGVRIAGVLQTGDLTQSNAERQWQIFNDYTSLVRHNIPTFFCAGNHDYPSLFGSNIGPRDQTRFSDYVDYAAEKADALEFYEEGRQENALLSLRAGGEDFMVLSLEYAPRRGVAEWAAQVAERYPERIFILLTHRYLKPGGGLSDPAPEQGLEDTFTGAMLWEGLVKNHSNIRIVLCGHDSFAEKRIARNDAGHDVTQVMFDPQDRPRGGNGWIQVWRFDAAQPGKIDVTTYNLFSRLSDTAPSATFSFSYT